MTRRLLFVTGTRADFGLWLPILRAAADHPALDPALLVTAMHLDDRFGATVTEVRAAGFRIAAEVPSTPAGDSAAEMAKAVGQATIGIAPVLEHERPDWLLLLGDRGEQLAAAIAGVHLMLPIAHLAGGDRTLGAVDDVLRDMISSAASLHFATSAASRDRLVGMGEEAWRVRLVGSPGLDDLASLAGADPGPVRARVGLPAEGPYLLILQHPETRSDRDPVSDLEATLAASAATGLPRIAILPNADAGGRAMADRLQREPDLHLHASLPRAEFAVLLANAAAIVGNSSAGLTEAPLLRIPAVNVGDRQAGRLQGDNVVNSRAGRPAVDAALQRALAPDFRAGLGGQSPHGGGESAASAIVQTLANEPIDRRLLVKRGR
jgi:GDP/UDP-N,N'-diacetylbacillosamine 2-epimerase (hydrolysing)